MSDLIEHAFSTLTNAQRTTTTTVQPRGPPPTVPGVNFNVLPRSPRSLILATGTDRFQVLLDYSNPSLRQYLRDARLAFNNAPALAREKQSLIQQVATLTQQLATTAATAQPSDPNQQTVPPPTTDPLTIVISPEHPQLAELTNERDLAISDLATITRELTDANLRIEALNARITQLESEAITPSTSASQVDSNLNAAPNVTEDQLRVLARTTRLAVSTSVESGHARLHPNHSPTGNYLFELFVRLARLQQARNDHGLTPHDLMVYQPLITTTPDYDNAPRRHALSAEATVINLLLRHTAAQLKAISNLEEHQCTLAAPCLINYLHTHHDNIKDLPSTAAVAMFYTDVITTTFNIRRYQMTALQLIGLVSDPTAIGIIADVATRRARQLGS
jgi:hypothetical protein